MVMSAKPEDPLSEAACAQAVYEDLVRRIKKFQAELKTNEKMVLHIGGVSTDSVGVRGATLWFQGRNNQGCAVMVVQHYTRLSAVMTAERLYKGEKPTPIGFFSE